MFPIGLAILGFVLLGAGSVARERRTGTVDRWLTRAGYVTLIAAAGLFVRLWIGIQPEL